MGPPLELFIKLLLPRGLLITSCGYTIGGGSPSRDGHRPRRQAHRDTQPAAEQQPPVDWQAVAAFLAASADGGQGCLEDLKTQVQQIRKVGQAGPQRPLQCKLQRRRLLAAFADVPHGCGRCRRRGRQQQAQQLDDASHSSDDHSWLGEARQEPVQHKGDRSELDVLEQQVEQPTVNRSLKVQLE